MNRPSRESVMESLFNSITSAVQTSFTADTQIGSKVLLNPSIFQTADGTWTADSAGGGTIFLGLPVFGPGIPRGAIVTNLSPLTISLAASAAATSISMTTGFVTAGRRLKFTRDVQTPAFFLRCQDEDNEYQEYMPVLTMKPEAFIVSNFGENPDVVPETMLNNFLDAIQSAMSPDEPGRMRFTLGGLVYWCRMSGKVLKDTGDTGPQAIAMAEIEIQIPALP